MKKFKIAGLALALGLTTNLYASDFSYNYVDLALGKAESTDINSSTGDYSSFSGGFVFQESLYFTVESTTYEYDNVDAETFQFGVGAYTATSLSNTDMYGTVRIANSEIGSVDESGFQIDGGIRSALTTHIELDAKLKYHDVFDDSGMGYQATVRFYPAPQISFGAGYEYYDFNNNDINTVYANFRYNF